MTNYQFTEGAPVQGHGQRLFVITEEEQNTGNCLTHPLRGDAENVQTGVEESTLVARAQGRKPNTATLHRFAGVVHPNSDGRTGKCMVRVTRRGLALVKVAAGVEEGDVLKLQDGSYEATRCSEGDVGFLRAIEDRGDTESNMAWCEILEGGKNASTNYAA